YLKSFMEIGLTEREAKVYITLLSGRMFTVLELQEAVNIPRTKIYEVLNKLVNRNICIEKKLGRNKLYEAVEPKLALERVLESYKKDLERKEELIKQVSEVFTPIFQNSKSIVNPLEFIDVMKEKGQIHKRYTACVHSTRREMLTFNKGPYACDTSDRLGEQEDEEYKLLKRGGLCKDIYELKELKEVDWLLNSVKKSLKLGQQARVVERLPIKMLVFDQEKVMFALEQPVLIPNELTMIYIEHKQLAEACSMLFYHLWDKGQDISEIGKDIVGEVESYSFVSN
ncbi:MAG: helix-turn-helix domain-containing protein, partial [Ignavibacteriaceae bacterium]|nr:helix-turn-helix domain-containing protein [Ignavibacteriaceae bacterium]